MLVGGGCRRAVFPALKLVRTPARALHHTHHRHVARARWAPAPWVARPLQWLVHGERVGGAGRGLSSTPTSPTGGNDNPANAPPSPEQKREWAEQMLNTIRTFTDEDFAKMDVKGATFWVMAGLEFRATHQHEEAGLFFSSAYKVAKAQLGGDHEDLIVFLQLVLDNLVTRQLYVDAETSAHELVRLHNLKAGDKPSMDLAEAHQRLGIVCDMQGKHNEALGSFQRAVELFDSSPITAESLPRAQATQHIADSVDKLGDHEKAERLYRHALAIVEKQVGFDDVRLAALYHALGCCLESQGKERWLEAEMALRKSIALRRAAAKGKEGDGLDTAVAALTLHTLAELFVKRNDPRQAKLLLHKAAKVRAHIFGDSSPMAVQTRAREAEVARLAEDQQQPAL